jgi:hypothetical protein
MSAPSSLGDDPRPVARRQLGKAARAVATPMRVRKASSQAGARESPEGLSKKDIIRCLKRYVAREVHALLPPVAAVREPLRAAA